jgi:endonuclease YncB( thermonuclease family)
MYALKKTSNCFKNVFCCWKSHVANKKPTDYLRTVKYEDTIPFIPLITHGKVIKVYDGDTITVASQLPFKGSPLYRFSVRMAHIDTPEMKGATPSECELAIQSRDALHRLIFGKIVELRNHSREKYGRLLADVYFHDLYINDWMVERQFAIRYEGGKKTQRSE